MTSTCNHPFVTTRVEWRGDTAYEIRECSVCLHLFSEKKRREQMGESHDKQAR